MPKRQTFNRTIKELKRKRQYVAGGFIYTFNRTIKELKRCAVDLRTNYFTNF